MEQTNSVKKEKKEYQTSLTNYLNSKTIKKAIHSQANQSKQHKINKPEENHKHVQRESRIIINKQHKQMTIRSHTDQLSSISAKSSSPQPLVQKKQTSSNINVLFYLNKIPSQPNGEFIDKMHENWFRNYEKLERDHSFIQWIFPNSFQSRFNIYAHPLSPTEAEQFRTNPQIYNRYLKSYEMMLGFYGLKLKDRTTGELMRSRDPDFKERMHKTLLTSFHNHMRITRICCSLTQTGFGRFAVELCKILKFQIYSKQGFMNSLQRYNVYKQWAPFELYDQKGLKSIYFHKINKKKETINPKNVSIEQISKQKQNKSQNLKQENEKYSIKVLIDKKQKE